MDDPDCELADVYRLSKTDPIMSGRLITLANSALFDSGQNENLNLKNEEVGLGMNQAMGLVYAL